MQILGLHESHDGDAAPRLLQELGRLHKDQVLAMARTNPTAAAAAAAVALKGFFFGCALLLAGTAGLGISLSLSSGRRRRSSLALLAGGTLIPLGCILLMSGVI